MTAGRISTGRQVAAAARATVGAAFRLHGRDAEGGLDCLGVAVLALQSAGYQATVPDGYRLRCGDAARFAECLRELEKADGMAAGDILLCRAGPGQLHVAVRTDRGIVHADAALRRVVERPGEPPWPVLAAWRLGQG